MKNNLINLILIFILFSVYLLSVFFINKHIMNNKKKQINFVKNLLLLKPLKYNIILIISNIIFIIFCIASIILSILNLNNLFHYELFLTMINSIVLILGLLNIFFITKRLSDEKI